MKCKKNCFKVILVLNASSGEEDIQKAVGKDVIAYHEKHESAKAFKKISKMNIYKLLEENYQIIVFDCYLIR